MNTRFFAPLRFAQNDSLHVLVERAVVGGGEAATNHRPKPTIITVILSEAKNLLYLT